MDVIRALAAWVLFVLMALLAAFFWHQSDSRGRHINELSAVIDDMETHIAALTESVGALEDQVEAASETVATLRAKAEELEEEASLADALPADDSDMELSMGDMLESLLLDDDDSSPMAMNGAGFMANLFDGPQGDMMLEAGTRMMLDMQYGEFFDMLAPENVDVVREILSDYLVQTARLGVKIMGTDGDDDSFDAVFQEMEAHEDSFLSELRDVIGDDGVALYEQYQLEMPARMLDQSLEMQLGMYARGLSVETRDMVRHTMVEEMLYAMPEDVMQRPDPAGMQLGITLQQEGYARALERLAPVLDEEEYHVVDNFVQQQLQMMEMFETMMGPGPGTP